jgi:hypothetical protein
MGWETCASKTGLLQTAKVQFMYSQEPLLLITRPPTTNQTQSEARPGVNKSRDTRSPGSKNVLPRYLTFVGPWYGTYCMTPFLRPEF